ncbi:MAG: hypothetical protein GY841_10255 [FCB group bacterium]|nr:hypothetical protein [FCB group bacterium]
MGLGEFSFALELSRRVGLVSICPLQKTATILSPVNPELLSDEDWLKLLKLATENGEELEGLGYTVTY